VICFQPFNLPEKKVNLVPHPSPLEFQLDFFRGGQEYEEEGKKKDS
jgi:hypothetical protein